MKTPSALLPVFAVVLAAPTGCESPGERLDRSLIDQIRDGVTRRSEILTTFGEPNQVTRSKEGATLFYYERVNIPVYQSGQSGFVPPHQNQGSWRGLSVLFGPDDVVKKHLGSEKEPDLSPTRTRFGRHFTQEDLLRITPRKTTETELTRLFGQPHSERLTLSGHRMLTWVYLEAHFGQIQSESVDVLLEADGVVTDVRASASEPSLRR